MIDNSTAKDHLSRNLSRILSERGLLQSKLAERTGEYEMTISRIVRGVSLPKAGTLARIAEALDVSIDRLLATPPVFPNQKSDENVSNQATVGLTTG